VKQMQLGYNQLGVTCSQLGTQCVYLVYYDRAFPGLYVNQNAPSVGITTGAPIAAIGVSSPGVFVSSSAPLSVVHGAIPSISVAVNDKPSASAFVYTFSPIITVNAPPAPDARLSSSAPGAAIGLNAPKTSVSSTSPDAKMN